MWERRTYTCLCDWVTLLCSRQWTDPCKPAIMEKIEITMKKNLFLTSFTKVSQYTVTAFFIKNPLVFLKKVIFFFPDSGTHHGWADLIKTRSSVQPDTSVKFQFVTRFPLKPRCWLALALTGMSPWHLQ